MFAIWGLGFEILSPGKEMQTRLTMDGTLSSCIPDMLGSGCSIHCRDLKTNPRPRGLLSRIGTNSTTSSPTPVVLGTSSVSLYGGVRPPPPPTLSDVRLQRSLRIATSAQHPSESFPDGPAVSAQAPTSLARSRVIAILPHKSRCIDDNNVLHLFFHHRFDVGPIRLTYIAHAFNYRIVVLRDGVKPAGCVGRSRRILDHVEILWSQQVAVMFQIICALALGVPEVLQELQYKSRLSS